VSDPFRTDGLADRVRVCLGSRNAVGQQSPAVVFCGYFSI